MNCLSFSGHLKLLSVTDRYDACNLVIISTLNQSWDLRSHSASVCSGLLIVTVPSAAIPKLFYTHSTALIPDHAWHSDPALDDRILLTNSTSGCRLCSFLSGLRTATSFERIDNAGALCSLLMLSIWRFWKCDHPRFWVIYQLSTAICTFHIVCCTATRDRQYSPKEGLIFSTTIRTWTLQD